MQKGDGMEIHINCFCNMKDELTTAGTTILDDEAVANLLKDHYPPLMLSLMLDL